MKVGTRRSINPKSAALIGGLLVIFSAELGSDIYRCDVLKIPNCDQANDDAAGRNRFGNGRPTWKRGAEQSPAADSRRGLRVAVVIGGTVGLGILRSPGAVAARLGSGWLVVLVWTLGGLYTLLAANNTAELATMMPRAGGPYVYARRAYGDYGGFVVGWSDWMFSALALRRADRASCHRARAVVHHRYHQCPAAVRTAHTAGAGP